MSELIESLKDEDGLDERERAFLDVLFDVCGGDVRAAMSEVGYPDTVSPASIRRKLSKEIQKRSKEYLIASSAKASISLVSVLNDPGGIGAKQIITASKEILDRASVVKEETPSAIEVRNMFILPAKDYSKDESEDDE